MPDVWPVVPIIAVNRHPVFPKFIKIIEVNDPKLIEIVRRKVKLNQPYAGIFVKKNDDNTEEIVNDINDLYPTGTFAQIVELQDLGSRVRMVLMAHRRIKLNKKVDEEPLAVTVTDPDGVVVSTVEEEPSELKNDKAVRKARGLDDGSQSILLGETENVKHNDFETTEEVTFHEALLNSFAYLIFAGESNDPRGY